ncbi:MAG: sigma-70 family RNA polymerase sigma factor [Planctomycetes bacterium]|nr:sigma-70 family RNA polymerase sigma factor [Planctomycetota bacterium]
MPKDPSSTERLTMLLQAAGDDAGAQRSVAFSSVYAELRRIARQHLAQERIGHTLQATALVHEAWLRLFGNQQSFGSRQEFLAAAANTMRRILVDHARARGRRKRGGGQRKVPLDALQLATMTDADDVLSVDEAVTALEQRDPRLAEQVKLRLFAGLEEAEVAAALDISDRTARRDWVLARAFLQRHLQPEG